MGRDKEFDTLFSQYQRLKTESLDIKEQLSEKQEQWKKKEKEYEVIFSHIKELCIDILAKDPSEMRLGTEYSWDKTDIDSLIEKARYSLKKYCITKTKVLRDAMDEAERRGEIIESLTEQLTLFKTQNTSESLSEIDKEELINQMMKEQDENRNQQKAINTMSPDTQDALEKGNVDLEVANQCKEGLQTGMATAQGDDFDFMDDEPPTHAKPIGAKEKKLLQDAANKNASSKVTSSSIRKKDSNAEKKYKQHQRKKSQFAMVDLSEYDKKITDVGWLILETIGETGLSLAIEIGQATMERHADNTFLSLKKISTVLSDLGKTKILDKETISTPFARNTIYTFSTEGKLIYERKFNKIPVPSEKDKIIAEHDNTLHGYAIKACAQKIENYGIFKTEIWNRKNNRLVFNGGTVEVIPDITCTDESGVKLYLEYENATYTQKEFNRKINKLLAVSPVVSIVCQNKESCTQVMEKVIVWAEDKGKGENLKNVIIRCTSANALACDLRENANWLYTYRPLYDDKVQENFTSQTN